MSKHFLPVAPGRAGLSLLITGAILVIMTVWAGGEKRSAVEAAVETESGRATGRALLANYAHPLDPAPKAEWEVLIGCELARTPTNAAHHFRVTWEGKPMVFELYFVEAPDLTEPNEDKVTELAGYFGWPRQGGAEAWTARSVDLGEQAWKAVESLLQTKPFMVLTKFDRRHDTHHFFGLVVFENEPGQRRTLQEWLVEQGFVRITRPALGWLPLQLESSRFVEQLEALELAAQKARRGGWGPIERSR